MTTTKLSCSRWVWHCLLLCLMLVAITKGIRIPGAWGFSHFLFDYEQGFTKRAIIGELYRHLGDYVQAYQTYVVFSLLVAAANAVCIFFGARCLLADGRTDTTAAALLYVSSVALTFLAHTVGYYDHIGLLGVFCVLFISRRSLQFVLATLLTAFCLLVHEGFLIIFFPSMFMALLLAAGQQWRWLCALFCLGGFALLFATRLSEATLDMHALNSLRDSMQARTPVTLRADAFGVLGRNVGNNYDIMVAQWDGSWLGFVFVNVSSWLVTLPVSLWLLAAAWRRLSAVAYRKTTSILLVAASLSPQLMHFIAWDTHRWNSLTLTSSFLCLLAVCRHLKNSQAAKSGNAPAAQQPMPALALALLFLNGSAGIVLFDGYTVRQFPFVEDVLCSPSQNGEPSDCETTKWLIQGILSEP